MGGSAVPQGTEYSKGVAFVYVFNLIVGAGALNLPNAMDEMGAILGTVCLALFAFFSYMTVTYMIEVMAASNAIFVHGRHVQQAYVDEDDAGDTGLASAPLTRALLAGAYQDPLDDSSVRGGRGRGASGRGSFNQNPADQAARAYTFADGTQMRASGKSADEDDDTAEPVKGASSEPEFEATPFNILLQVEMGTMVEQLWSKGGVIAFYICIIVYLYGDLAIYAVTVPQSLQITVCPQPNYTHTYNETINGTMHLITNYTVPSSWPCMGSLDNTDAYNVFLALFALCIGPFCFFNVQKTKYLQLCTTVTRYMAFIFMIALAANGITSGDGPNPVTVIKTFNWDNIPIMFGVAIYSFMCHHSLPSLITPLRSKKGIFPLLFWDFVLVLSFYLVLCYTAVFRFQFGQIESIYTYNFATYRIAFFKYFLLLFPVLVLSTNFPIIVITLRNNLATLFARKSGRPYHWAVQRILFPLLALTPPIAVAFITTNVNLLVSFTGSYAGLGIQYIVPLFLVWAVRRRLLHDDLAHLGPNPHRSPFGHVFFFYLILVWSVACVGLVTWYHVENM